MPAQPGTGNAQFVADIGKHANSSLLFGAIGIFCCGIILGPLAIARGGKALALIKQSTLGQEHAIKAQIGRVLGVLAVVFWVIAMIINISSR